MNRLNFRLASLLMLAIMFALVPATRADNLAPGGVTTNLTPLPGDLPIGPALGTLSGPFQGSLFGGNPTGNYVAQVFRNANGGLDFTYDFTVTGGSVTTAAMATFLPSLLGSIFRTDVFVLPGTGVTPSSASRTGAPGDFLAFQYVPNTVNAGESSLTLVIATDAHQFNNEGILGLIGGDTASVRAFQPIGAPIPEPSSMLLLGTGLSTVAATLRRRMKNQAQL